MAHSNVLRAVHGSPETEYAPPLGDLRFGRLLPRADWRTLPLAVRRRFSKRVANATAAVFRGEIVETEITFVGWLIGQAARLLGSPLPRCRDIHVPAVVSVMEDTRSGGQIWTRIYARNNRFPQVIHSAKQFAGVTGLEEHVGAGIGMALHVEEDDGALVFRSAFYFWKLFGLRIVLPAFLTPGALTVTHREEGHGAFSFRLEIVHPLFGRIICQTARFREVM